MQMQTQGRGAIVTPLKKDGWKESKEFNTLEDARREGERLARKDNVPIAVYKPVEIFVPQGELKNFGDGSTSNSTNQHSGSQSDYDSLNPRITPVS